MQTFHSTPRRDGFRMPAEFEPHAGCWMAWPQRSDVWRRNAHPAQLAFVEVSTAISQFEPVTMCASREQWTKARSKLPPHIRVVELSTDDAWMRDQAPTYVIDGAQGTRGVDWDFNARGGLDGGNYFPWDQDELVARKLLDLQGI